MIRRTLLVAILCFGAALPAGVRSAGAQPPGARGGDVVPRDVREIYDRGLQYLVSKQHESGDWREGGGDVGPGVTGLCLMVLLASGEDPNYGQYAVNIRRAVRSIILNQDPDTGYFGNSMYHQGFATLGLAEAYGAVDERSLWVGAGDSGTLSRSGRTGKKNSIGQALELAVRGAITSQKNNSYGAWRYSPSGTDADTSVAGAVLMGLLAARNAGIEVPDEAVDKAIGYFTQMTSDGGQVGYSGGFGGFDESMPRISIATLVYSIARRKDLPQFKATSKYLTERADQVNVNNGYGEYTLYYQAQALFQADVAAWEKWNKLLVVQLKQSQLQDGSFRGSHGPIVGTSMTILGLALNYKFLPIYER